MNKNAIRCLITAGPTREYIDPVRFVSNPSSGKMGYALAQAAAELGWIIDLVSGPVALKAPEGVNLHKVITGNEMFEKCDQMFPNCDLLIMCAAVCDMRPVKAFDQKQKKDQIEWKIEFEKVIDILKTLSGKRTTQTLVGFAAETQNVPAYAQKKLREKNLDWIVGNDVSGKETGFESDLNSVEIFSKTGESFKYGPKNKTDIAFDILKTIASI